MPIQLIITGDHMVDVFAEVSNFAYAIGNGTTPEKNVIGVNKPQTASTPSAATTTAPKSTSTAAPSAGGKTEAKADDKLSREDQDAAVAAMIDNGEKDERYEQLTKGRQKAVDDGIAAKAAPAADSVEDMFGDSEETAAPVVTAQTIRDMMGALGKDEAGNPVQDNLLKIRDILTKFVTKGAEIKVGNIPADKLTAVYAELKKLEA